MSNSQPHAADSGSLVTSQSDVLSFRATIAAGRLRLLRGLCLAALLISGYLAWSAIQLRPVIGCGGSDLIDCDHVLNSHWSKIFGLPVSIPAVGLYATLLGLLAGLDVPSEGTVKLDGEDLFALDEDARAALRARALGFVFQSFQLLANRTALENVMLPLELAGRRDARAAATDMLQRVGLGQRLNHYPRLLSGGEQQRVALARAFVVQPKVLLADEPTGSLDAETGRAVIDLLVALNRDAGTTLVLVTHDPGAVTALNPERVLILPDGDEDLWSEGYADLVELA